MIKKFISQIVCDDATGNHLLGRKRQEGYWEVRKEIIEAENSETLTKRQTDILEYYKQSSIMIIGSLCLLKKDYSKFRKKICIL